jgi:dUTP pyrophosphatase
MAGAPQRRIGPHLRGYCRRVIEVPIVRLDPGLSVPSYARDGDAGMDLVAREDAVVPAGGGRVLMPTGMAVAIPHGYAGFVLPRSGMALRHGITVANSPGLIDSGYRGELQVILLNTDATNDFHVVRGNRIAQLVVQKVEEVGWIPVAGLPEDSERGAGGFGHSGD